MRLLIFFLLLPGFSYGQNLVPNWSFEDTISCNCVTGECTELLSDWSSFRNSPDYYNACMPPSPWNGVPSNYMGYQYAATGNAYCGLYAYLDSFLFNDVRENLGAQLITSLSIGQKYYLSMKVSFTRGPITNDECATDKLGMLLTTQFYDNFNTKVPTNNFSHLSSNSPITDSTGWTLISGSIIADSSYAYVSVGNFYLDDSLTLVGNDSCVGYYYVDDVCVSTDSLTCFTETGIDEVSNEEELLIYPNPTTGIFTVQDVTGEIQVYDLFGRLVLRSNKKEIDMGSYPKGIYMVRVGEAIRKLILH